MTTYLFIGLILVLAAYLVRRRRGRSGDDASVGRRPPLRPPAKAAPQPAGARAGTAAAAAPAPHEPLATAQPASPPAEPALSWTPEETIVEPGWPLPGEIAGGWAASPADASPFPDGAAAPVAVLEWEPPPETPAPGGGEHPGEPAADLPAAEEWAMPSRDPGGSGESSAGPPLWVPGEVEGETPGSGDEDADLPPWGDEASSGAVALEQSAAALSAPPAMADEPPMIAWGPLTVIPEPSGDDGDPPAAAEPVAGLVWADASPAPAPEVTAPSAWEAVAPLADLTAAPDPQTPAEDHPAGAADAPHETQPVPDTEAAPVPAVAWERPPDAEDAVPSSGPAPPDTPAETSAEIFGALTPAPVWPPEAAPAPPPAPETPTTADSWSPPPAPSPSTPAVALESAIPFTRVCDRLGVTPRMLVLMRMLAETPRSISEQARELGVSRPLVADLCARLESAGLARREPVATDRRRVHIALTDAGNRLCEETAGTPGADSIETLVGGLSADERARLLARLQAEDRTA